MPKRRTSIACIQYKRKNDALDEISEILNLSHRPLTNRKVITRLMKRYELSADMGGVLDLLAEIRKARLVNIEQFEAFLIRKWTTI